MTRQDKARIASGWACIRCKLSKQIRCQQNNSKKNLNDIKEDRADDVLKKVRTADFLANQRLSSNSINEKLTDVFSLRHKFFEVDR